MTSRNSSASPITLGEKVYEWLKDEKRWCKQHMFIDKDGEIINSVNILDKNKLRDKVCKTCLMGAFLLHEPNVPHGYWARIKKLTKFESVTVWNDRPKTTHKQVLAVVKAIIQWEKGRATSNGVSA